MSSVEDAGAYQHLRPEMEKFVLLLSNDIIYNI